MDDCYRTLQIDPSAEPEVVDAAWRRLAQLYHPDGARPNPERMKAINVAHDVLKDPDRRAAHDRGGEQGRAEPVRAQRPAAPEMACSQHRDRVAASWCGSCWQPLCHACAEVSWPSPRCVRCARRQLRKHKRQIAWPIAYVLAWLVVAVLWSSFAAAWAPTQPWADLEEAGPSAVVGYVFGCGVIGSIDLAGLCRRSGEGLGPLGCVGLLIISPLVVAAGCVVAPIRAVVATMSWVGGLVEGRRLLRHAI